MDQIKALIFKNFVKEAKPGDTFFFSLLRNFAPFYTFKRNGAIITVVSRAGDMREILSQSTVFGNGNRYGMDPAFAPGFFLMARDQHEPEHDHEKSIMRSLLLREDLPKVREMTFNFAKANIEEAMKDGATDIDLIEVLSKQVPVQIVDKYFGFEPPNYDIMKTWSDTLQGSFFYNVTADPDSPYNDKTAAKVGKEARDYIRSTLLPKKRKALEKNPDIQDPVSRMLRTMLVQEAKFDEERVVANTLGFLVGCIETNNNAIIKTLDRLMAMPHAMALAREAIEEGDDDKLIKICWEALRWNAPSVYLSRIVNEDVVLNGHEFKKGTRVLCSHRSAFFDPKWIHKPNEFRIDRPSEIVPAFHFGSGVHTCLGNYIATELMPMVIKAILTYKPGVKRVGAEVGELETKTGTVFVKNVRIAFTDEEFQKPKEKKSLGLVVAFVVVAAAVAYGTLN
jgi:cytochrome P450